MNGRLRFILSLCYVASALVDLSVAQGWPTAKNEVAQISGSLLENWNLLESQIISLAEAMPEANYAFAPTAGEFRGVRTFAEQIKHVACANFAFFREMQSETPPSDCEHGGPDKARTKQELVKYLRDSFSFGTSAISNIDSTGAQQYIDGPYGGHRTRLSMVVLAIWHGSDHYGQLVEYARMNGVVPPASNPR